MTGDAGVGPSIARTQRALGARRGEPDGGGVPAGWGRVFVDRSQPGGIRFVPRRLMWPAKASDTSECRRRVLGRLAAGSPVIERNQRSRAKRTSKTFVQTDHVPHRSVSAIDQSVSADSDWHHRVSSDLHLRARLCAPFFDVMRFDPRVDGGRFFPPRRQPLLSYREITTIASLWSGPSGAPAPWSTGDPHPFCSSACTHFNIKRFNPSTWIEILRHGDHGGDRAGRREAQVASQATHCWGSVQAGPPWRSVVI
jgi:hypothetical protein